MCVRVCAHACVCVKGMVDECEGCVYANMKVYTKQYPQMHRVPFPHIVTLQ